MSPGPPPRLIFDSARSSAAVGVRAVATAGRSLVFRSEDLTVDVVIHSGADDWGYHYGQVIRNADGSPAVGYVVALDEGDGVTTDECGQFSIASLDARAARSLHVRSEEGAVTFALPR